MYKKLVGILVCMLFIATMAIPISAIEKEQEHNPEINIADVPVWEVGDSWTYDLYYFSRDAINLTRGVELTCEFTWTVEDDSGVDYILIGKSKSLSISGWVGTTNMVGGRFAKLTAEMVVGKADLSIKSFDQTASGYVFIKLGILTIPIPLHARDWRFSKFTPNFQILPFPLSDGKNGEFDSVEYEEEIGTTLLWGLVEVYIGNNSYETGTRDYTCFEEQITVPAGTYDTYNVTSEVPYNFVTLHYNADVGNIVSLYTVHYDHGEWWLIMDFKLTSTTYSP